MSNDSNGLKGKVLFAGSWVAIGHFVAQLIRFFGNLVLTRLLMPELFGIMAIASAFLMGISMLSDVGLTQNVVQSKKSENAAYLNTAWSIQIIRGIGIFIIALIISYILYQLGQSGFFAKGSVYNDPQLPKVLSVLSVVALIAGFNSMNLAMQNRNLTLHKVVVIEISSQILGLIVMIILAWYAPSIWPLIIGGIISTFAKMLLSHHPSLGPPSKVAWDNSAIQEIIDFGKWIFVSSIFTFLVGQGDRLILGALVSPRELGIYIIAFFLAKALGDAIGKISSSVFYPALADVVRNRPEDLKRIYYQIRNKVDIIIMIVAGLMASMGHLAIEFLYDDRYHEAGWMLNLLSLFLIFLGTSMAGMCFMALGNTKPIAIMTMASTVTLYISVPIAYSFYGLFGAVLAITLNSLTQLPIIFFYMRKYQLWSLWMEIRWLPVFLLCYVLGLSIITILE